MASASNSAVPGDGGGFMQPPPLSPAASASTVTPSVLPKQRSHPLRAGSIKETTVINHVDKAILAINRRHAKKFSSVFDQPQVPPQAQGRDGTTITPAAENGGEQEVEKAGERGYENFRDVVKDIGGVVDVLWVSGTPSLQIPYLISLSVLVNSYLPDYPFTAKATFRLLRKLDSFFASLILGEDAETGQPLSGFEGRANVVSMTEKVRIKSIAETARVVVVEAGEERDPADDGDDLEDDEDEDEMEMEDERFGMGDGPGRWEMETARVYEKTIQLLGDELGTEVEFCDEDMARGEEREKDLSTCP
ncbi:hypothetical protein BDW62DRAFT_89809 [Aspergillus aurantiobrunneus]